MQDTARYPKVYTDQLGLGQILFGSSPSPSFSDDSSSTNYPISNKYESPTIDSIGFVEEGFLDVFGRLDL